jgi:hypothetical protein
MINALTGLGFGIISLAVIIGIGIVILVTLGANVASTSQTANATLNTLAGYLGTGSGGLATWVPIIIVLVVGLMFLGAFAVKKGKGY